MTIIPYDDRYRDDMIFMVLQAKDALGRKPTINPDLLDIKAHYIVLTEYKRQKKKALKTLEKRGGICHNICKRTNAKSDRRLAGEKDVSAREL